MKKSAECKHTHSRVVGQQVKQNRMTTTFYEKGVAVAWECRRKCGAETTRWYDRNEYYNHFRKYHPKIKYCPVSGCHSTFKRYGALSKHIIKIHKEKPEKYYRD